MILSKKETGHGLGLDGNKILRYHLMQNLEIKYSYAWTL